MSLIREMFLLPVKFYRKFISPLKGQGSCRFIPTCSEYALIAVREWGVLVGTALTLYRILRCNPFCRGGFDPPPRRKKNREADGEGDRSADQEKKGKDGF